MYKFILPFVLGLGFSLQGAQVADEALSKQKWSEFGPLCKVYSAGRKGYPEAVFAVLKKYVKPDAKIVDMGSGTGISTRQLCQYGFEDVIGADRDALMIKEAEAVNTDTFAIKYILADVVKGLPFADNEFDVVTSFTSFHWFSNPSSIKEVVRIIKPEGYYFVVRSDTAKNNNHKINRTINQIIEAEIGDRIPDKEVDPAAVLEAQGLKIVVNAPISHVNYFTKQEYLNYIQSKSVWNLVTKASKSQVVLKKIEQYLDTVADADGKIKEEKVLRVVLAQKQS